MSGEYGRIRPGQERRTRRQERRERIRERLAAGPVKSPGGRLALRLIILALLVVAGTWVVTQLQPIG